MITRTAAFCFFLWTVLARADTLDAILSRMDAAAPNFHALNSNVDMDSFDSLLNDHTPDQGTFQMQRQGGNVRAIIAFTGKDARTISFQGRTVTIYYPNLNTYQTADMGKDSQLVNQFLLLGFGSSGKELAAGYSIALKGQENVAGQTTTELELIPKDAATLKKLAKVDIWVPAGEAYPAQQQFYEPSGNWRKVTYSQVVLNPPIAGKKGVLEFKLPPNAQRTK